MVILFNPRIPSECKEDKSSIVEMERKIQRRPVKLVVATQIETIVESMFEEEEDCG